MLSTLLTELLFIDFTDQCDTGCNSTSCQFLPNFIHPRLVGAPTFILTIVLALESTKCQLIISKMIVLHCCISTAKDLWLLNIMATRLYQNVFERSFAN